MRENAWTGTGRGRTARRVRRAWALASLALLACEADGGPQRTGDAALADGAADAAADVAVHDEGLGLDYGATSGGPVARFAPGGEGFTATPWPSDRLRRSDGTIDLSGMPNPLGVDLVAAYLAYGSIALDGFSRNGAVYFELSALLDPATLPSDTAAQSDPRAPVQLVDLTPGAATYGQRLPLVFAQRTPDDDFYYAGPTLALRPVYGFPLADAGTYCAVLTRALRDPAARFLEPAPAFLAALPTDPTLAPLRAWLPTSPLAAVDLAAATCFTTQDATGELYRLARYLDALDTPTLTDVTLLGARPHHHELTARYVAPNFQHGLKPYAQEGGDLRFDPTGAPLPADPETLRVRLLVPRSLPMPRTGWSVVLYSHGTGGDWSSCLDATDADLQRDGLAMLCIDQPLHGLRGAGHADPTLYAFNFLNPASGRASFRQAAADTLFLSKLVADGRFDLPPDATGLAAPIRLDPSRVLFFGHSHGGLAGALALGVDARLAGGVLSGASGVLVETLLRRKDPVDIAALLAQLLGLDAAQLDTFHPILTVAQTLVDATDPINYAPLWLSPPGPWPAKHVFVTEGTADAASPSVGADALAAAAGLPLVAPVVQASRAHELRALAPVSLPVTANLVTPFGDTVTAALKQFPGGDHFVAFDSPEARALWRGFLRSLGAAGLPTLAP